MKLLPFMLGLTGMSALALSAAGQSAGQSIIFSTPQGDVVPPSRTAPGSDGASAGNLPGTLQAPVPMFEISPPSESPPPPVAPGNPVQQQRLQNFLRDRKNWIFMTPAEILGSSTTESLLEPPERDALGREKTTTALERFLQRESRARNGLTNGWPEKRVTSPGYALRNAYYESRLEEPRNHSAAGARAANQFPGLPPNGAESFAQTGNSSWETFSQSTPPTATKPDPQQVAAMDRFRQLLNSGPDVPAQTAENGVFGSPTAAPTDPFMMRPDFLPNPAGASFTPVGSGLARPAGLTPLPDAVPGLLPSADTPSWKLQPAPWLLPGPQPFVMPQRKGF